MNHEATLLIMPKAESRQRMMRKRNQKKAKKPIKPWKEFEKAVNKFLELLLRGDPNALVKFDPPKVDRDTKKKQQVDAWIDYKIGGHFPVKMLVSCKDHGRKLDVKEIRVFIQEIEDCGASTGAIYSRAGFTDGAVAKANARGIGCFQLWRDQPADLPVIQLYRRCWCCDSVMTPVVKPGDAGFSPKTWEELFDLRVTVDGPEQSLGDCLEDALQKGKTFVLDEMKRLGLTEFPDDFICTIDLRDSSDRSTTIMLACRWKRFHGKLSAAMLNGSFCVSNGEFVGTETAAFPTVYPPPPSDWEEVSGNLLKTPDVRSILLTRNSSSLVKLLRAELKDKPISWA